MDWTGKGIVIGIEAGGKSHGHAVGALFFFPVIFKLFFASGENGKK